MKSQDAATKELVKLTGRVLRMKSDTLKGYVDFTRAEIVIDERHLAPDLTKAEVSFNLGQPHQHAGDVWFYDRRVTLRDGRMAGHRWLLIFRGGLLAEIYLKHTR